MNQDVSLGSIPKHVAIVMDGNGRWAQNRGLSRLSGHEQGAKTATDIMEYCRELGIQYLTLYAFSSENWGRPETEVDGLMSILYEYLLKQKDSLIRNQVRLHTIGNVKRLPLYVQSAVREVQEITKGYSKHHLILALSYGARDEIKRSLQKIAEDVKNQTLDPNDITEDTISCYLDTAEIPDPELLIRTSGEQRLSNFLLWQLSYTELFFVEKLWPDFNREDLNLVLNSYQKRSRRYGLTAEQIGISI